MSLDMRGLFIGGAWVEPVDGHKVPDVDPATGEVFAEVWEGGLADLDKALEAATAARTGWADTPPARREALLFKAAEVLESKQDKIFEILGQESGSTVGKIGFEIAASADFLRSAAGECRRIVGETIPSDMPGMFSFTVRKPLGVVAGITPFNVPLLLQTKKIALALAAGNTFILKPSPHTPLTGLLMGEIFEEAGFPPGVFNVVPGDGALLGGQLVEDPRVALVTFTGSSAIGKQLAAKAAANLKKFTLELGGKSPLVVLDDADIDYAVEAALFSTYFHQGQACMASSRLVVDKTVVDEFRDKLVGRVKALVIGDPRDPSTTIGPLIHPKQCAFIEKQIADATAAGARVLTGGKRWVPPESNGQDKANRPPLSKEHFFEPTVMDQITRDMSLYRDESFGPVTNILTANGADEALEIANDTAFGLSAAVITRDIDRAFDLALKIDSGMVHINDGTLMDLPNVPFGGVKDSGFGREGGHWSIDEMTEVKWITLQRGGRPFPLPGT